MTEGIKHDGDKVRLDLIPPEAIFALGRILTFGAVKYTKEVSSEWARVIFAANMDRVRLDTPWGAAVLVTRSISGGQIQTSRSDSAGTDVTGKREIPTGFESFSDNVSMILGVEREMQKLSAGGFSPNTGSPPTNTKNTSGEAAPSAAEQTPRGFTLTIATRQGHSVGFFAANATTASECLATALKDWSARLPTSELSSATVIEPGARNWEKGMKWGRVFGAAMRHLWCWWGGQAPATLNFAFGDLDDETKFSHLWHALCCVAFLVTYEQRGVGQDDRFKAAP